ncbi:polysaccharide synthesis protein exod [Thiohalocapsa halophila]|uniref:Polysaccharide synthesis protein exod n=1 Tax=Thiohalocapsa halophila TaxID=69359 RepID=A0ABS1CMB9_9GAMM|nr:exopolysaccharide biosynthesis protein [Thiohalocapsa halophila]MBK1633081.1 polysaccharide synthesis protein exod [Thiohalocapsa halophila]
MNERPVDDVADEVEEAAPRRGLIAALEVIAEEAPADGMTLLEFTHALGERAFGLMLFALAVPVCIPLLYGIPQIVSLPMIAIAVQMAMGRPEPWMPRRFGERRLSRSGLIQMANGARKWFGWIEAVARPRLLLLSGPTAERVVGAVFVVFIASILIPFPATNTLPGIGIAMASIGLITRDGLLVLAGLAIGLVWITLLVVGIAVFGPAFIDLFKDALKSLLGLG